MRVAHLTTVDLSLRYLVLPQLSGVIDLGGEALGISAPGPYVEELEAVGIRHLSLPASTRGFDLGADLAAARQLWRLLRAERPDVLHTHTPKPGVYGRIVGRLAGVPVVVNTVHGLYATPDDPWPRRVVVYALEALAARFSHAELVQSREDTELVRRLRLTPPKRTRFLGNGVDLTRFDPGRFDEAHRRDLRRELGADDDTVVVGMVGRLVREKGFPELFAAARELPGRYLVVAVGPHQPDKADAVSAAELDEARRHGVVHLGMRPDVDELYDAMDVFALPSHREGFPRAAMEAAAMGLPVVASDVRGCREVVDDGRTGLLFPVGDAGALAAALRRLGDDPELRRRMGVAARAKAEAEFDERRVVRTVIATQVRLLRERGRFEVLRGADVRLRPAVTDDARVLARLHADGISTGFLPRLGTGFLTELYLALVEEETVIVADDGYAPVGFVAGSVDAGAFLRRFVRSRGLRAAAAVHVRGLRPGNLRRALETWRYDGDRLGVPAELLSMAVAAPFRERGLGGTLGRAFLTELARRGAARVKVVVGADNAAAIGTYRSLGFEAADEIEVHAGERSLVMVR